MSVNDVDGNLSTTQLTVTNGTVTVSVAGGATISAGANGSSTLTLTGTQAQINAALASLSYQGNADFNGADTLTVLSTDTNGATDSDAVAITVSSVNDGPVNTVPGRADGQRRHRTLDRRDFGQRRRWQPRDHPTHRHQRRAEREPGGRRDDQRGRQRLFDPDALRHPGADQRRSGELCRYQGNADFNGARHAHGSVDRRERRDRFRRGGDTVTSVNDGPLNTVPGAQTVNEDTSLSIGGISVNDVDGNLSTTQLTVTNGAST